VGFLHKTRDRLRLVWSRLESVRPSIQETPVPAVESSSVAEPTALNQDTLHTSPGQPSSRFFERDSYQTIRERVVTFLHEQARDIETISGSVQLIQNKAQNLLQNAKSQHGNLGELVGSAQKALQDIQAFTQAASEIRSIQSSIQELLTLEESIRSNLTEIDSVVLNSKILAFNAALEASRAGMEGKGFLVVAEKMQEFSLEISKIGKDIRGNTEKSKVMLSRVTEDLNAGFTQMDKATQVSVQLVDQVQKEMRHIEEASANSVAELEHHAQDIQELRNKIAATVEESSSSSADMVSFLQDSQIHQLEPAEIARNLAEFDHIIDVRRPDEFNAELGHLANARLLTIDETFAGKLAEFPRDLNYVFVCRSGGRSARAARIAIDMGFLHVTNMKGGMLKWKEQELPSVQDAGELTKAAGH
jgi:hydroxyacylglutathione hydrolase